MKISQFLRKEQVWGTLVSLVVMAVVAIAFFYPDALEGNTLQQHDVTQGIANGEEARAYHEATGETTRWTNSLFGGMPTFQIAPSYPADGMFKWIGTVYSLGLPGPAGLLMMMMSGMYILMMTLSCRWYYSLVAAVAWGLSSYFIIIIGAGHLWKFLTLTYVPPTIAGVILAYRRYYLGGGALAALGLMMQLVSNHVQMTYYFGFVIVLLAVAYLVDSWRNGKLRQWCVASAVLVAAALVAVGANAPNLYNTWKYTPETIRGGHSELTQGESNATDGGLDRDYLTQYSYGVGETWTLMIPDVKGGATNRPVKGVNEPMNLTDLPDAQAVMDARGLNEYERQYIAYYVPQYFGEPEGTNGPVYVGAIICALFLAGCFLVKGPVKWALLTATVLSIGLAWGRNFMSLTDLFINLVPMYSKFRTPESILVIAEFTMPVLGVLGLRELFDMAHARRNIKVASWSFGFVAFMGLVGWLFPGLYGNPVSEGDRQLSARISEAYLQNGVPRETVEMFSISNPRIALTVAELRKGMVSRDSASTMLLALLAGGCVIGAIAMGRRKQDKNYATMAVGVVGLLILLDLYSTDKRYVNHDCFVKADTSATVIPETAADRAILADTTMYYRVMPMGRSFYSAIPSYRHHSIGGYHAAKLSRYNDLISTYLADFAAGDIDTRNYNIVNMLNGRYLLSDDGRYQLNNEAMGNAWLVDSIVYVDGPKDEIALAGTVVPRARAVADEKFKASLGNSVPAAEGDTIYLTSYAPDKLTYKYRTSAPDQVAVFSEVYFPWGWEATVDGSEPLAIDRVNYLLRAARLPEGEHTIAMSFAPSAMKTTGTLSVVCVILIFLWSITAIAYPAVSCNGCDKKTA